MKLSFDFDPHSYDDMSKMTDIMKGPDYRDLLYELDKSLRSKLKYEEIEGWPADAINFLENLRDEINFEVDFSDR